MAEYPQIGVRVDEDFLKQIDDWRRKQDDLPGRPKAIRRLVEIGLKAARPLKPAAKPGRRRRAAELASEAIESIIDPSATPDERNRRRRRLMKGPPEFREERVDLPKAKGAPK